MCEAPVISVIIAVYQAEKYMRRCLDSIQAQSFSDFETILVGDGSVDESGSICDEYARKDHRFHVIHKQNEGVSIARQIGLNAAKGEYVIHADPDDWVEQDWLLKLYRKIADEKADMVICDYERVYSGKRITCVQQPTSLNNNDILSDLLNGKIWGVCWNKLIRKDCFEHYHVSFPPKMQIWEDLYVITWLVANNIKVVYLPEILYHYDSFTNEDSVIRHLKLHDRIVSIMFYIDSMTPFLSSRQFDDGWYRIKSELKEIIFLLNDSHFNIIDLYSEINERYIHDHNKLFSFKGLVALSLKGHSSSAHFIYSLYRVISKPKRALYEWTIS